MAGEGGGVQAPDDPGAPHPERGVDGVDGPAGDGAPRGATVPVTPPPTSSPRLVATLAVAGVVAGFFIVLVHQWSQPKIEAHQARVLQEALSEVLNGPAETATFFLVDGAFTATPPPAADTAAADRLYVGYDDVGTPMGVALTAGEPGFMDIIGLIFGYDPGSERVLGMKVLESKETPGLGDKIEKDSVFVAGFNGVDAPLVGVKPGAGSGADNEVDMITGATISAQAIVDIINNRLAAVGPQVDALWQGGVPAPGGGP
jgi:electron transport complex protein RnfG